MFAAGSAVERSRGKQTSFASSRFQKRFRCCASCTRKVTNTEQRWRCGWKGWNGSLRSLTLISHSKQTFSKLGRERDLRSHRFHFDLLHLHLLLLHLLLLPSLSCLLKKKPKKTQERVYSRRRSVSLVHKTDTLVMEKAFFRPPSDAASRGPPHS